MKEPYSEWIAIHPNPEPCGADREGGLEALVGACAGAGRPLSRQDLPHSGCRDRRHDRARDHQTSSNCRDGAQGVRRRHPHERPRPGHRSPKPRFHAFARKVRERSVATYLEFLVVYQIAAERLAGGSVGVTFPENSYLPHFPFVAPRGWSRDSVGRRGAVNMSWRLCRRAGEVCTYVRKCSDSGVVGCSGVGESPI